MSGSDKFVFASLNIRSLMSNFNQNMLLIFLGITYLKHFCVYIYIYNNPCSHGRGQIWQHYFRRPVGQKDVKRKSRQMFAIPRKVSAESMFWGMYPIIKRYVMTFLRFRTGHSLKNAS